MYATAGHFAEPRARPSGDAPFVAVAGLSGRMLAQSAAHAGYQVVALDLFGDRDTRLYSKLWIDIGGQGLSIDRGKLRAALERVARLPRLLGFVTGSGLEPHIDFVQHAAQLPRMIGNDPDATAAVREPCRFFALLDELGIAHPDVAFERPKHPEGWLHKLADGCGGTHIRAAANANANADTDANADARSSGYFQRQSAGASMSALFLAARREASIIGYAEQLCVPSGALPYVHAGSLGPVDLPARVTEQIGFAVRSIASRANLRGLHSIDFLLDGDSVSVLEVNARPSSTMALYERSSRIAWPRGLLAAHIDACLHDRLPDSRMNAPMNAPSCRVAQQVVFAPAAFTATRRFSDTLYVDPVCHDIPNAGTRIEAGQPVCTVLVTGDSRAALQRELQRHTQRLLQHIETCLEPAHEPVDSHG
ncbi:ATP-grasp domain-containing protein [Paraburkholderia piptadeniae]|nr:ATP-grasp domain-containing protein [Paraburkholderia piptadeniae]